MLAVFFQLASVGEFSVFVKVKPLVRREKVFVARVRTVLNAAWRKFGFTQKSSSNGLRVSHMKKFG